MVLSCRGPHCSSGYPFFYVAFWLLPLGLWVDNSAQEGM